MSSLGHAHAATRRHGLFRLLRAEAPATARIMLSGSDCDGALGDIDELLAKPCSASVLRAAIERALSRH